VNTPIERNYDVIVIGARVSGSALAIHLARSGKRVAVVDRARFPSDTMSTHVVYPNTIFRMGDLGVLDAVMTHKPPPLYTAWHHEGRMWVAPHTPVDGRDWAICVRRITLDTLLVDRARALGATVIEGLSVTGLHGMGTAEDPVRGIVATDGEHVHELFAPIVVGADGVNSTMAKLVGAQRTKVMPSQTMLYFAYWTGAKSRNTQDFFFEPPWICAHFPADDDHHVVTMNGPTELRRDIRDLEVFYLDRIRSIPALWSRLDGATKVSRVIGSTRLEGYYRQHTGAGWALIGDAAHFKHPAAAQGIGDAFHAAQVLAGAIIRGDWMTTYPAWREGESREIYAFCKHLAEPPGHESMRTLMHAFIHDAALARRMVDVWARAASPWTDVIPHVAGMAQTTGRSVDEVLAPIERPSRMGESAEVCA
jgi:flavin-dependent dehydrogenase